MKMEKKYRHTELNNEELKKLFTSMPISYNYLAGNEEGKALLKKYNEEHKKEELYEGRN